MTDNKKPITHYPRGEMCLSCIHLHKNCSSLPFPTYKVIGVDKGTQLKEVKCAEFRRDE